jgi:hypothetical protein
MKALRKRIAAPGQWKVAKSAHDSSGLPSLPSHRQASRAGTTTSSRKSLIPRIPLRAEARKLGNLFYGRDGGEAAPDQAVTADPFVRRWFVTGAGADPGSPGAPRSRVDKNRPPQRSSYRIGQARRRARGRSAPLGRHAVPSGLLTAHVSEDAAQRAAEQHPLVHDPKDIENAVGPRPCDQQVSRPPHPAGRVRDPVPAVH